VLPETLRGDSHNGNRQQTVEFHIERLGRIARILNDHGCRLGLEIMGPTSARDRLRAPFITGYADLPLYLDELRQRHPNVGVLIDAFHLYAAGEEPEAGLCWEGEAIVCVHVVDPVEADRGQLLDTQRCLPGETELARCQHLLNMLQSRSYTGPVTAEPLGRCPSLHGLDPLNIARRTKAALNSVWPVEPLPTEVAS
jgi:sugar phosphate isomerase/epimerase